MKIDNHCSTLNHLPLVDQQRRTFLRSFASALGPLALTAPGLGGLVTPAPAQAATNLKLGQPAPNLTLRTLEGQQIRTQDLVGQLVILTFWATWCEPCREELPILSMFNERHKDAGVQVLGFSLDTPDALPKVQRVASSLSFPVGLLGSAYAGDYGRIWNLPVNFVIDRAGRLAYNGWDDNTPSWSMPHLHSVMDPLL